MCLKSLLRRLGSLHRAINTLFLAASPRPTFKVLFSHSSVILQACCFLMFLGHRASAIEPKRTDNIFCQPSGLFFWLWLALAPFCTSLTYLLQAVTHIDAGDVSAEVKTKMVIFRYTTILEAMGIALACGFHPSVTFGSGAGWRIIIGHFSSSRHTIRTFQGSRGPGR